MVLSHPLWQELYGGDQEIVGAVIRLNEEPHTVVGVMPPDFELIDPTVGLWLPLIPNPDTRSRGGGPRSG